MTLQELRRLAESVRRIPCDPLVHLSDEVREFNASVTRFQELVVLVRNRIVLSEAGVVPAGADQVRQLALDLSSRRPTPPSGWLLEPAGAPARSGGRAERAR